MSDLKKVEKKLRARLEELEERIDDIEEDLSTPGGDDLDEIALEADDDQVLETLNYAAEKEIEEIKVALGRIAAGTYGKCVGCSNESAAGRLEAIPFTSHCIQCA